MLLSPVDRPTGAAYHQLLEVLNNVPVPLTVLHGPAHVVTFSNRNVPTGRPFVETFPELAARALPILDRVYRDGKTENEQEIALDGRFLHCSYVPLRGEDGNIEGVILSTLDVTAEVRGRTAAENQGKWLEFVLDLIPIPTILVRPGTGDVLFTNAATRRTLVHSPDEIGTAENAYFFTDLDGKRVPRSDWPRFRAARGEELYGLQLFWHAPRVTIPLVVESRRLPQAYGHPEVVAIHYQDVTDLKQAERELQESIIDLQRERELRERFIATLTHDLRNPLTAAKISADLIVRENPESPDLKRLSGRIKGSIVRADRMVRDLLDANRIKAGERFPLRIGNHCLNDIAQGCIDGLAVLHGDRFCLDAPERIRGRWCRSSLKRVFENLCGNAAKYAAPGSPITVTLAEADGEVLICVHNLGSPIPREEQPGLFQAYHRTKSAVDGPSGGWGLGLVLVRGIAEAHDGSVFLDYSDDRGTRFCVKLPKIAAG